jgi:hypothetical protein
MKKSLRRSRRALDRNTEAFGKTVQCLEQAVDLISLHTAKEIKR